MTQKIIPFFFILMSITLFQCKKEKEDTFPVYFQETPTDCGPICLKMICEFYNIDTDIEQLKTLSNYNKEIGTSFLGLSSAADSLGIQNLAVKLSYEDIQTVPLPAIMHWKGNHFIVVYKANNHRIWTVDPAYGKKEYSKAEFCKGWFNDLNQLIIKEGFALLFEAS